MSVAEGQWPVVGATGARFGSASSRRRVRRNDLVYSPADEPVRQSGAAPSAPGAAADVRRNATVEGEIARVSVRIPGRVARDVSSAGVEEMEHQTSSFVRPFVRSGGRTRAEVELPLEALVSAVPAAEGADTPNSMHEHRMVLELCRQPRSIMEVAALAGIPLGVARVLVGDLAATGELTVHRTVDRVGPGAELLERVLTGLHEL